MTANELFENFLEVEPSQQDSESLSSLPAIKGVVLFADDADRPIQLLITGNIRRLVKCRLFGSDKTFSTKRTNIAEITQRIYYRCCYNDFSCNFEHWQIARRLWPDSYQKLTIVFKNSYVKIDLSLKWPQFVLTDKPFIQEKTKLFGPFPNRKSANSFIEILQEVFGLCRMGKMFNSDVRAISCPYLQMGQCTGPCVGKVDRSEYFLQITQAITAAGGNTKEQKASLENRMQRLCKQMEFEQAEVIKKRLERLELLNKKNYRWTRDLADLKILHIDISAKITEPGKRKKTQTFSAFLMRYGCISRLTDFTLNNIEDFQNIFFSELSHNSIDAEPEVISDQMALVSYFLYRSKPSGIWLDYGSNKPKPSIGQIKDVICERFGLEHKS